MIAAATWALGLGELLPGEWFSPRLSLGLGNPNSAAALIAMALVSGLPFCFGAGWRRGLGVVMALAGGLALAMTASRGGVVALAAGLLVLGLAGRIARADRILLGGVALVVVAVFGLSPAGGRVHAPGEDASLASRERILSQVPAMIAAAPGGWGAGRSGEAYRSWFQAPGDFTKFKHVLSTHAIWLVERPWAVGWLYVTGWALAFAWCAVRGPAWATGGLACWVVFGVAGMFSHVGERGEMWLLPFAWLVVVAGVRIRESRFPSRRLVLGTMAAAGLIFAGLILLGRPWGPGPRLRGGMVEMGVGTRRVSVMLRGPMAEREGQFVRSNVPAGIVFESSWQGGGRLRGEVLLLAGDATEIRLAPGLTVRRVGWISPEHVLPWTLPAEVRQAPIVVISGQGMPWAVAPWRKYFGEGGRGELKIIPEFGNYLSDSWERLLAAGGLSK